MSGKTTRRLALVAALAAASSWLSSCETPESPIETIFDHVCANVDGVTADDVALAKERLTVAYWHTSHGSQLVTGVDGMDGFFGGRGWYAIGGDEGLRLAEQGTDIGNPGISEFDASVRAYLSGNPETNVVMASWCGQVSSADESEIGRYLAAMEGLESDFPGVAFVYMTGHADGTGLEGNLHLRNAQIRDHCEAGGKWLFDFYDIECYDPDGTYFGDRNVDDACGYDGGNWAEEWQAANPDGWWDCESAHSAPVNANMKAMAAWRLWIALAADI